jgi:hypothetical protein
MLLSRGKIAYNGPVSEVKNYFANLGYEVHTILTTASELQRLTKK